VVKAFKRSLFGYRKKDVEKALAARDAALAEGAKSLAWHAGELERRRERVAQLELVCDMLSDRVVRRDRELESMRAELTWARREVDRIEAMGVQARSQATRIRLQALREASELSARMAEVSQSPAADRGRLLDAIRAAIDRMGLKETAAAAAARADGRVRDAADEIFEGLVEIEVGPLEDFSQLVGFEDAAEAIDATSEISVRRFKSGRATLEMRLAEPVELLRELEERAPFEFKVRDRRFDRLILDVDQLDGE
jgi:chromosome segregation ATPase